MRNCLIILMTIGATMAHAQTFEKVDNEVTASNTGSRAATFADVNGDGWLDIYITNGKTGGQNNELYLNDGSGGFNLGAAGIVSDNSPTDGATWGDIDNDGDLDLFFVTWYGEKNYFFTNDNGILSESDEISSSGFSETASWGDYNNDGYLDLYITNSSNGAGSPNEFFVNNGDGRFTTVSGNLINQTSVNSRSINWIDIDNDNDLDIFISNESAANELYLNTDGNYSAANAGLSNIRNSTGSSWADYDNDGDLDLFVANYAQANELFQNDGTGNFTSMLSSTFNSNLNFSFGSVWADLDNDGDLDLFVANGFRNGQSIKNDLYWNNGDGTFREDTESTLVSELGWSFGAAAGDYDNDGFLDLLVANCFNEAQKNALFHNTGNDNNWIILDLEGMASNKSAIGAKVKVTATIGGETVTQLREISAQSCYNGQNSLRAHFGLGDARQIDQIEIIWPLGHAQQLDPMAINQIVKVQETIPANFLRANFALENVRHEVGASIQIKDLSVYPEGDEVIYEWDFDNDGTIDSNEMSPSFQMDEEGKYSIKLKVSNGRESNEKVRTDYLEVVHNILDVNHPVELQVVFYPNPAHGELTIESKTRIMELRILDLAGQEIWREDTLNHENQLLTLKLPALDGGQYLIIARDDQGLDHSKKMIIQE